MANAIIKPTWSKYEKALHAEDTDTSVKAGEAFEEERKKELAHSRKAREWEADRRNEWAKNKPLFAKQKREEANSLITEQIRKLREGGYLMENLKPAPGFVLIKPDPNTDRATASGVILPGAVAEETCTATVLRSSEPRVWPNNVEKCPCSDNDRILYRHDAGLKLTIKGDKLLLIGFGDVLGTLEE